MTVPAWFFNDLHMVMNALQTGDPDRAANLLQILFDFLTVTEE